MVIIKIDKFLNVPSWSSVYNENIKVLNIMKNVGSKICCERTQ